MSIEKIKKHFVLNYASLITIGVVNEFFNKNPTKKMTKTDWNHIIKTSWDETKLRYKIDINKKGKIIELTEKI